MTDKSTSGPVTNVNIDSGTGKLSFSTQTAPATPAVAVPTTDSANGVIVYVPGPVGPRGPSGGDGTHLFALSGAPSLSVGVYGDCYIDTDSMSFYGPKSALGWGIPIMLRGNQGPAGPAGVAGPAGNTILSGIGAPSASIGNVGDYYFQIETVTLWGEKVPNDGWTHSINLRGPMGNQGSAGTAGAPGVGISTAVISPTNGHLVLTLTDGSTTDAGIARSEFDQTYQYPIANTSRRSILDVLNERLSILDFVLTTTTEPDATGMFTRAINTVNQLGVRASIELPYGTYTISAPLPAILVDHIQFVGHGSDGSLLNITCDGPAFTWSGYGGGFKDITIQYPSPPPANAVVALISNGNGQIIEDCRVWNIRTLAQIGTDTTPGYALSIRGVLGNVYNGGSPFVKITGVGGAGLFISGCGVYVDGVGNPAATLEDGTSANRTSTMTTVPGTNFIDAVGTKFDTIVISNGCILERWYHGLNFVTNVISDLIINIFVDETTIFDYTRDNCYNFVSNGSQSGGSGGIWSARLGGHCNSWEGHVVYCLGDSNNKLHEFDRLKMDFAGKHGIFLDGTLCQHIRINRLQGGASGRMGTSVGTTNVGDGNSYCGIKIDFAEWVTITEAEAGYNGALGGLPWQADYGVSIPADMGAFQMTGCKCDGAIAPYDIPVNTVVSQNRIVVNNLNALYSGIQSGAGYQLGANGDAAYLWHNLTYFNVRVSVATADNIYLNGVAAGATSGEFTLIPGENIAIDSTTPTALFRVLP